MICGQIHTLGAFFPLKEKKLPYQLDIWLDYPLSPSGHLLKETILMIFTGFEPQPHNRVPQMTGIMILTAAPFLPHFYSFPPSYPIPTSPKHFTGLHQGTNVLAGTSVWTSLNNTVTCTSGLMKRKV